MARTSEPVAWLSLVDVSGPFLVGDVLEQAFPQGLEKIETPRRQRLRAAYDEWQEAVEEDDPQLTSLHDAWVRMVLEDGLEYDRESLATKAELAGGITYRSPEHGTEYSPDFAVRGGDGSPRLLIAVFPPETNLENPPPQETWPASPAERMVLLCRANQCRIGLVTNGEQWMLVNAPVGETSGYASWYARFWWQEPVTLKAFQSLLGVRRCFGPEEDTLPRLLERSLDFQEAVTNTLGEQVRRAVEVLIQALGRADQDRNGELLKDIAPAELYEAGLTVMMRLVFILSAEERGLLLLGDPLYDQHYAVSTLRAKLREDADQYGVEVLERRHDAWSRLLATFRGIFGGIEHEALRLPALGGSLFDPDRFPFLEGRAPKTKWREQPAVPLPIDNRTVLLLMTALQILEQKGGAQLLSYRALDVEQIGHVYEGLLEFTAARVPEITLGLIGTKKLPNPQITLSELDSIAANGEDALLEHLKERTGRSLPALRKALKAEECPAVLVRLVHASNGDETLARRLLPFGELIRADSWGNLLVYRQGSFAIVKGTDRRSSGTHYTPRSLTEPIVRYTLEPLVYVGPAEGPPQGEWKLKSSADILALKVCDMACGSGAFLVEACRYLSLRLIEAWAIEEARGLHIGIDGIARGTEGDHELLPKHLDDRLLVARRLVAQSCIYGVDINHLAVELAKLSVWLVTLAKNKPFSFIDHALRCGDSLVGLHDLEQLRFFSLKPDAENSILFKGPLNSAVDDAIELRLKLEGKPADTVADVEAQGRLLAEAEDDVARLKCAADLLVSAEFWGESNADRLERTRDAAVKSAYYIDKGPAEEFQQVAAKERRGQKMFHWPLEFPEVIVKRGGFDAFVGNPPFKGGKFIRGLLGDECSEFLRLIYSHIKGSPDLVAYFLLRAVSLTRFSGSVGLICTKSIFQGETRENSLDYLYLGKQATERRRIENHKWPGVAAVHIAIVWLYRNPPVSSTSISVTMPSAGHNLVVPHRLNANANTCFQGTNIVNSGFIVDPEWCHDLIQKSHSFSDVLFPLIEGAALNATPTASWRRWIIDFHDWPLERALEYEQCIKVVIEQVKPHRMTSNRERYRRLWWQFGERQQGLYERAQSLAEVIVIAYTSNTLAFTFAPSRNVVFYNTSVICSDSISRFAVLQSSFHVEWIREYGSSLKGDARYAPERCYESFPFCDNSALLADVGHRYFECRKLMMLDTDEGLTKTYNRFHANDETGADVQRLRDFHIEMDIAVAAAYGWTDLDLGHGFHETKQGTRFTINEVARREVMQRLLKLNHERYAAEEKQGLHGKRTGASKRNPRSKASTLQTSIFDKRDDQ